MTNEDTSTGSAVLDYPDFDPEKPILIVGTGVMGGLVAWATARSGIPVHAYDATPGKAQAARIEALTWSKGSEKSRVSDNFLVFDTLAEAGKGVQLAFENVFEDLAVKTEVLAEIGSVLPKSIYMGSNASSLTCTPLAKSSGRASRFFNLNFTDPRSSKLVELMGCADTTEPTLEFARAWARHIGMVPVTTNREQMGYSFNRLWRVIKKEVLRQIDQGYATAEDIDRAWMLSFGMDIGPCGMMDSISLPTIEKVETQYYLNSGDESDRPPQFLQNMIDAGQLGVSSNQGFYNYPNPDYLQPGWLCGETEQ